MNKKSMLLDLTNPKIALIHGFLTEALEKNDIKKMNQYITDDAVIIINEKKLQRHEFENRVAWIKNNIKSVKIKLHNAFFDGNQGFDYHTTEAIDTNGKRALYKIFGYTQIKNGKICRYEDVTIQLEGAEAMSAVTSTT